MTWIIHYTFHIYLNNIETTKEKLYRDIENNHSWSLQKIEEENYGKNIRQKLIEALDNLEIIDLKQDFILLKTNVEKGNMVIGQYFLQSFHKILNEKYINGFVTINDKHFYDLNKCKYIQDVCPCLNKDYYTELQNKMFTHIF